jgi:hypothetical protein
MFSKRPKPPVVGRRPNSQNLCDALREAGSQDLIGSGCDCLIPSSPPREAVEARRKDANTRFRGDYVHTVPGERLAQGGQQQKKRPRKQSRHQPGNAYRPDQNAAQRQKKRPHE